ncbi:acetoacetyl-CoA synthetase [Nephila pilipes]|uniref:Acetoacetyl-CoA synthetase n=1 Tax=Nephila pilipes TaxID=299642 RepID=A0A8X6PAV2_NEPPI|nr:acetoacetyl-CoA synthetase [Nephila pilipes]
MSFHQIPNAPLVWRPEKHHGDNMKKFKKIIEDKYLVKLEGYEDFYKWSVENICEFWAELWDFLEIIYSRRFDKVVDLNVPMSDLPKWFEGAKLNHAENLLKYKDDRLALIVDGEDTEIQTYTFAQMHEQTRLYAAAFRKIGLKKGDIVICHMSNRKEALFATQAVISIGAIWTAALPMLGAQAVLRRFQQLNAKILLSEDGYRLEGKDVDLLPKLAEIVEGCTELAQLALLRETTLPAYKEQMNAATLGMPMQIFDNNGHSVIGEAGEIVISKPLPNLPLGLWNDNDGSVYREKYFSKYPGKYTMLDFIIKKINFSGICEKL